MLHSICQQICKTQQWPQDWKRSVFIPFPEKGNAKEHSDYHTIALITHASKVMLKILPARLQQYMNWELPTVQAEFRKGRGTRDQIANIRWIIEKAREFQKNIYFCFTDYTKDFVSISGYSTFALGLGVTLLRESNATADLIGGRAQAVMWAVGSGCKYRWSLPHPPFTFYCIGLFLTDQALVLVWGPGVRDSWPRSFVAKLLYPDSKISITSKPWVICGEEFLPQREPRNCYEKQD